MSQTDTPNQPHALDAVVELPRRSLPGWFAAGIVGLLLTVFGTLSFTAVLGKSATYDEPLHAVGGMVHRLRGDYRINPEDPALFGWWASLPHSADSISLDDPLAQTYFTTARMVMAYQWHYVIQCMYARGAVAADSFLNTSRFMFVILGIALGLLIAVWAYQLGGTWAAIAAATLYCLDPNFLGHSALVKNDVPLSLFLCAMGFTLWRFGKTGGWYWPILGVLASALAVNTKFSGVLFGPMILTLVLVRALLGGTWPILGTPLNSRLKRAVILIPVLALLVVTTWGVTWLVYGRRYSATNDGEPLPTENYAINSISNTIRAKSVREGTPISSKADLEFLVRKKLDEGKIEGNDTDNRSYPLPVRVDLWMQKNRLLPEGWLFGFLYTYTTTLIRSAYLLGKTRLIGWWYYFPLAMLFKTPTATLLALVAIPVTALICGARPKFANGPEETENTGDWKWSTLAMLIPPVIYFAAAMMTNLNLGLRHILPVYPYLFVSLGVGFAAILRRRTRVGIWVGAVIALALLAETVSAYPNYLAFFNFPSGGSRGGLRLLADSNLDWGQDLEAVAEWSQKHPGVPIYLVYFGMAKPAAYDFPHSNLVGGYTMLEPGSETINNGMLVISATNVQRVYWPAEIVDLYLKLLAPKVEQQLATMPAGDERDDAMAKALREVKPTEVLNGTMYMYEFPPRAQ